MRPLNVKAEFGMIRLQRMAQVATSTLLLVWMSIVLRYLLIPKVILLISALVTCISSPVRDCFCFFVFYLQKLFVS